jgi:hypothetical protein
VAALEVMRGLPSAIRRSRQAVHPPLEAMTPDVVAQVKARVRARLPADAMGRVTYRARANAIKGRVPT